MKIKICGITNAHDYNHIINQGVDYTGFIFYKKSPRYIDPQSAQEIIKNAPVSSHQKVGVFVNEDIDVVKHIYTTVGLDLVQLHGNENKEYITALNLPYIKVYRMKDEETIASIKSEKSTTPVLIDTYKKDTYGGTGYSIDPTLIKKTVSIHPKTLVAGGINCDNINRILQLHPYGVDINSGVEISPGQKDHYKVSKIVSLIQAGI